jgi:hypothetical protein
MEKLILNESVEKPRKTLLGRISRSALASATLLTGCAIDKTPEHAQPLENQTTTIPTENPTKEKAAIVRYDNGTHEVNRTFYEETISSEREAYIATFGQNQKLGENIYDRCKLVQDTGLAYPLVVLKEDGTFFLHSMDMIAFEGKFKESVGVGMNMKETVQKLVEYFDSDKNQMLGENEIGAALRAFDIPILGRKVVMDKIREHTSFTDKGITPDELKEMFKQYNLWYEKTDDGMITNQELK